MIKRFAAAFFIAATMTSGASAQDFLTIFLNDGDALRVRPFDADSIASLRYSRVLAGDDTDSDNELDGNEWEEPMSAFTHLDVIMKNGNYTSFPLDSIQQYGFNAMVPVLRINTQDYVEEITSKTDYLKGYFTADCRGRYEDIDSVEVNIRGRGNTTWMYPKKPYRLKFDKKISLFGLAKAKSYALLANHLDNTQMCNAVAFRAAQLLDMPFTNHSIPVDVYLNDIYKGSYQLTEKTGINSVSVDIDEETGIMWEIDTNFDEDPKFISPVYSLRVMVKDPDFEALAEDDPSVSADDRFEIWKGDFVRMEKAVKEGRWSEEIDLDALVDYMVVYDFCGNREISHPKSTFMYKEKIGEKYQMGPIWDFDWAFNYINKPDLHLFEASLNGLNFFFDIVKTKEFMDAFDRRWKYFKENVYPQVMAYVDYYAAMIRVSALQNGELWPLSRNVNTTETFDQNVEAFKQWIVDRVEYIDTHPNRGLFR